MKQERKTGRKMLSFLLAIAMTIGLVPGTSMTAKADDNTLNLKAALDDNAAYGPTMLEDGGFESLTTITADWTYVDNGNTSGKYSCNGWGTTDNIK